ncbi:MAG: hypothetical protein R3348_05780 [Xanthomonadales bacterium]|nr:hypothetical protein [Xanthomonadales bacterium]
MSRSPSKSTVWRIAPALLALATNVVLADQHPDEWAEDLALYRQEVLEADRSYPPPARARAETLFKELERDHRQMTDPQIELALARISALAGNGHSFLTPGGWTRRYPRLPVSFHVFGDGIYVLKATQDHEALVGSRLIAIDGVSVEHLEKTWARYQSGKPGWRALYLPHFLEAPALLHAAGLAKSPHSVRLSVASDTGTEHQWEVPARDDLAPLEGIDLYLAPNRLLEVSSTKNPDSIPMYLREPAKMFRHRMLESKSARYIQFRANTDFSGQQDLNDFIDTLTDSLHSGPQGHIILDQRFNYGGDLNPTRPLMQQLARHLGHKGKLFIITSGRTFSAGISSVGYAKQAAGVKAIIVGEPIGDALEFWAEGDLKVLPHSGVAFLMATERHNYINGCPEPDCHGSIRRNPIRVESLQPDVPAPLSYRKFAGGADPALEAIFRLIEQENQ